jgi:phosphoenolpyruvate carboxykinase (GTP)
MKQLLHVDPDEWRAELPPIVEYFAEFEDRLPQVLNDQLEGLRRRLG